MDSHREKEPLLEAQRSTPSQVDGQDEPSLAELQQNVFRAQRIYMKAWSRTTSGRWHMRIMFFVTALLFTFMIFSVAVIAQDSLSEDGRKSASDSKVRLEAHIMSKCPDARDCLHDLILPTMQRVYDKVDFKLSYIGR